MLFALVRYGLRRVLLPCRTLSVAYYSCAKPELRNGMNRHSLLLVVSTLGTLWPAAGQGPPDPAALIAAQRDAMVRLAYMDGVWRGPAWTILDSGKKHSITQTERIGPFLSGSVKVIEGRGYDADGTVSFNAFGTISYDSVKREYTLHSYAQGYVGDFVLKLSSDVYIWEIPSCPMPIRYTSRIKYVV